MNERDNTETERAVGALDETSAVIGAALCTG